MDYGLMAIIGIAISTAFVIFFSIIKLSEE